jgi:hypothetical protein
MTVREAYELSLAAPDEFANACPLTINVNGTTAFWLTVEETEQAWVKMVESYEDTEANK